MHISSTPPSNASSFNSGTESSNHQGSTIQAIQDFVVSFLHPYISGQIDAQQAKQRKPLAEALFDKFPCTNSSEQDDMLSIAFNAYLKQAALGLYVHIKRKARKKKHRPLKLKIIKPSSSKFTLLVNALKEALPIDFPHKNFSEMNNIDELAAQALKEVNEEKTKLDKKTKEVSRVGNANERYHKLARLIENNVLFSNLIAAPSASTSDTPTQKEDNPVLVSLEKQLVSKFASSTFDIQNFENQLKSVLTSHPISPFLPRIKICQSLLAISKKALSMQGWLNNNQIKELKNIKKDIVNSYNKYITEKHKNPDFIYYIDNILNLVNYIERLSHLKNTLIKLKIESKTISNKILEIEESQWNDLIYTNPDDNHAVIQENSTAGLQRFNLLIEAGHLIHLQASTFLIDDELRSQVIALVEECLTTETIATSEIIEKFQKILD